MTAPTSPEDRRPRELEEVVAEYLDRLNSGENLDPARILAEHPDSGEVILEELYTFLDLLTDRATADKGSLGAIGDYTLRREIGRGGMGIVYEAWESSMNRPVALKVLPVGVAADGRALSRFVREAQVAGSLQHTNVVSVYGMGVKENTPYYAMEYVEGETLAQILEQFRDQADPEIAAAQRLFGLDGCDLAYYARLANTFAGIADGLQHAHSKGVVHRDIKPSNLILDRERRLRILDFGLARLEGQESLTVSSDVLGTPLYMSPEQARRRRVEVDHRTDVYSLGATMYELLTWRPPFRGKDHQDTLSQIIQRDPVGPRKLDPRIPGDLETIVLKCLRKEPRDRYGTAEALAQDLRRFSRGDPIEARPQSPVERLIRTAVRQRVRVGAGVVTLLLLAASALLLRGYSLGLRQEREDRYREMVVEAVAMMQPALQTAKEGPLGALAVDPHRDRFIPAGLEGPRQARDVRRALALLDEALALIGEWPDAHYHRAKALLLTGREDDALEAARRASGFIPARALEVSIRGRRGDATREPGEAGLVFETWLEAHGAVLDGRWEDAVEAYGELLDMESAGAEAYAGAALEVRLGRGVARLECGDLHGAVRDFATARDRWPEAEEPALLLGKAYLELGREYSERGLPGLARETIGEARRVFQDLHEGAPPAERDRVALAIASVLRLADRAKEGLFWAQRVEDPYLKERSSAMFLQRLGRYEEFHEACERALALRPDDAFVRHLVAQVSISRGELDQALEWSQKARDLDDANPYVRWTLGHALYALKEYGAAVAEFDAAIALDPRWASAYYDRGRALGVQGRVEEAERMYREAIRLDMGKWVHSLRSAPWRTLWTSLMRQGRTSDAVTEAREGVRRFRRDVELWGKLGHTLRLEGDDAGAFRAYTGAVAADARDSKRWCEPLFAIHHRAGGDALAAPWKELVEELEAQRFDIIDDRPWLLVALGLGSLHGRKDAARAREFIGRAVEKSGRRGPDALAALAEIEIRDGRLAEAVLALEEMLRLPGADHVLEGRLRGCRRSLLPGVVSCASIDAALEWPDAGNIALRATGEDAAILERYLAARLLQREGKHEEAAETFRGLLGSEAARRHATVGLTESLRAAGRPGEAEAALREALCGELRAEKALWHFWLSVSLDDLQRRPAEVVQGLPAAQEDDDYGSDIAWLLGRLGAGESIRIDCGGPGCVDAGNREWGRDRFFLAGEEASPYEADIGETLEDPIYRTERAFRSRDRAGYRIPLPRGGYRVTLHFAEFWYRAPGCRRFDVRIEENDVLPDFDPFTPGRVIPKVEAFTIELADGVLDIELVPRREWPKISAIEVVRTN